jgi:hypothetical protein
MREKMDALASTEGATLNHLIRVAIAEKLARVEHESWSAHERRKSQQSPVHPAVKG